MGLILLNLQRYEFLSGTPGFYPFIAQLLCKLQ